VFSWYGITQECADTGPASADSPKAAVRREVDCPWLWLKIEIAYARICGVTDRLVELDDHGGPDGLLGDFGEVCAGVGERGMAGSVEVTVWICVDGIWAGHRGALPDAGL
jgi:hypothetical protein